MDINDDSQEHESLEAMRQQNIGRLFQRAARAYSELALRKLQAHGYEHITLFHTALISNLDTSGTRISTLADRAGMTKQAMGQLVAELEEGGYITREIDPIDKRATLIYFTGAGWKLLEVAHQLKMEIEAEYIAAMGEVNMRTLRNLLEMLIIKNL
ncbi:MAG TPA: MarR family transcriptional regulator [Phototrophicaceae bacterium]|jgi:DNA-binding MarR family transcriptional regulator|nr:MarR family transcriptional regulator [Phototrophicaceae bacterium]